MMNKTLVCIAGYGRSGSTMLEMLLARRLDALGLGEVKYAWSRGFLRGDTCSCGKAAQDCPFWQAALGRVRQAIGKGPNEAEALRNAVERNRHHWAHRLLGIPSSRYDEARAQYVSLLSQIYAQAEAFGSGDYLIDSSKDPAHVDLAIDAWSGRTVVIHLVRDPRAVVYSRRYSRRSPDALRQNGVLRSCTEWNAINVASDKLRHRAEYALVRYEDLSTDPGVLHELVTQIAGGDTPPPNSTGGGTGHALSGNSMRWEVDGIEAPVLDTRWHTALPAWERRLTGVLCAPVMARYGYSSAAD